jgi:hypothetical protein
MASPDINNEEFDLSWGFFIYRTVYTAELDSLWPIALRRVRDYAGKGVEGNTRRPEDKEKIQSRYKTYIFNDRQQFENATITQLREHYREWSARNGIKLDTRARGFIVIDEECLYSLMQAPEIAAQGDWGDQAQYYVKLVDVDYDANPPTPKNSRAMNPPRQDDGVMKVTIWLLYLLWSRMEYLDFEE